MKISFLGAKVNIYRLGNQTVYSVCDKSGKAVKTVKHTQYRGGLRKKEVLSPNGDLVKSVTYKNINGKDVVSVYDSKKNPTRISITESDKDTKNSVVTEFCDGGEKVSRILSIEKKSDMTEISEVLYDNTGKISETNYRIISKKN